MKHLLKLRQHIIGEVWCAIVYSRRGFEEILSLRLLNGVILISSADISLCYQQFENSFEPFHRSLRVGEWVEKSGITW